VQGYLGGESPKALSASQEAEPEGTQSATPADAEPATDLEDSGPLRDGPGSTRNPKAYSNPDAKSRKSGGYIGDMDSSAVLGSSAQNPYAYKPFKPGKKGK
jgi:hypothetical protein